MVAASLLVVQNRMGDVLALMVETSGLMVITMPVGVSIGMLGVGASTCAVFSLHFVSIRSVFAVVVICR